MKGDDLVNRVASRRLSRRGFLGAAVLAGVGVAGLALVGCGKKKKAEQPATAAKPAEEKPAAQPPAQEKPAEAPAAAQGTVITVTLRDFEIDVNPGSAPAGDVTFSVMNNGPSDHQLVVLGDNLPNATGLPLTADRTQVDEAGRGIAASYKIEPFPAGETRELSVPGMPRGRYVLICNIPGHYQMGMRIGFLVGEGRTLGT